MWALTDRSSLCRDAVLANWYSTNLEGKNAIWSMWTWHQVLICQFRRRLKLFVLARSNGLSKIASSFGLKPSVLRLRFMVIVRVLFLHGIQSTFNVFFAWEPISSKVSYVICRVIRCQTNWKKSPTKVRLFSLQTDSWIVSHKIDFFCALMNLGAIHLRQRLEIVTPVILDPDDVMP